ncbi:MAG: DCC1-like thiol-disulfide oxidoreductase family protein, partial [Candidatus Limnocylindrales bacterium]
VQQAAIDERALVRAVAAGHSLHDELHVLDLASGRVMSGGAAVLEITTCLPGGRVPALLGRIPPAAWAIGVGYALVARNRRAISRALRLETVCRLPQPGKPSVRTARSWG